jgi:hypothetical protein
MGKSAEDWSRFSNGLPMSIQANRKKTVVNTTKFGNPLLSGKILREGDRTTTHAMSRRGVLVWLIIHLAVLLSTATFSWNEAFGGTIQKVDTGRTNSRGEAITEIVVVNETTGVHTPMSEIDMTRAESLMARL